MAIIDLSVNAFTSYVNDISKTVNEVEERMSFLESKRESLIAQSRSIIRGTKRIIHSIHLGESYEILSLQKEIDALSKEIAKEPELQSFANVTDAMMEFSEAAILAAIVENKPVPSFKDLNVTPQAWALGLADCLGEIRRLILDSMLRGDVKRAEKLFNEMEAIYPLIMNFDVPDAILPIRRKQDIARSVVEKTRTDLVYALMKK